MSDASNTPVTRKFGKREITSADFAIPDQTFSAEELDNRGTRGISIAQTVPELDFNKEYMKQLAFNEEPMTIRIEPNPRTDNPETHAPCSVNGRGAEILMNNKWIVSGWLPIGQVIITKRKYVEVLARSSETTVRTVHEDTGTSDPRNRERKITSRPYPFTVIQDNNPVGHEWLTRILTNA